MQRQIERLKLDPWQNTKRVASSAIPIEVTDIDNMQILLHFSSSNRALKFQFRIILNILFSEGSNFTSKLKQKSEQKYEVDTNLRTPRCHHHLAIEIPIADCLLSSYFCRPRGRPSPDTGPRGALGGTRARPRFGWLELGILGSWVDEAWKMMEPPKGLLEVSLFVVSQVGLTWICPPSFKQSWSWTQIWRKKFCEFQWQEARCTRCLVFFPTSWRPLVIWLDCILSTSWNRKTIWILKYMVVVARNNLGMVKNNSWGLSPSAYVHVI